MKKIAATVVALGLSATMLTLALMSFSHGTAKTLPIGPPFDLFWCQDDDDCAVVERIGCCPCDQGGGQGAVTSWHRDDLRLFLKSACKPAQKCVQVDLCRKDVTSRCVDRRCRLVPKTAEQVGKEPS